LNTKLKPQLNETTAPNVHSGIMFKVVREGHIKMRIKNTQKSLLPCHCLSS